MENLQLYQRKAEFCSEGRELLLQLFFSFFHPLACLKRSERRKKEYLGLLPRRHINTGVFAHVLCWMTAVHHTRRKEAKIYWLQTHLPYVLKLLLRPTLSLSLRQWKIMNIWCAYWRWILIKFWEQCIADICTSETSSRPSHENWFNLRRISSSSSAAAMKSHFVCSYGKFSISYLSLSFSGFIAIAPSSSSSLLARSLF